LTFKIVTKLQDKIHALSTNLPTIQHLISE
jgi:hypothetical protein